MISQFHLDARGWARPRYWSATVRRRVHLLASLVLLCTVAVNAQPTRPYFRMTWNAPGECSPARQFDDKLAVLLGSSPEEILSAPLSVSAQVRQTDGGEWQVVLAFTQQGETRNRHLTSKSCDELGEASALLVAFAVDPRAETRMVAAEPANALPPAVPDASAGSAGPAAAPLAHPAAVHSAPLVQPALALQGEVATVSLGRDLSVPHDTNHRWARFHPFLGLGPSVSFGVLPGVGFGGQAFGGLRSPHLRLSLEGSLATSRQVSLSSDPSAHAHFSSAALALSPCWLVNLGSGLALGPCVGAELGTLWGRGQGLDNTRTAEKPWGSLRLGALAELRVSQSVGVVVAGDAGAPFGRPRFLLAGEEVHRPNATVGGLRILGELHFP